MNSVVVPPPPPPPPPPPTVTAIVVTPPTANLLTTATQQFTATATLSNGGTQTNPAVTWAATGGTITTGGLYTAGLLAGPFRVIATQSGGTLADTSAVTLAVGLRTYTTLFPLIENPISEAGKWVNGGTTGLDWTNVSTTPGLAIGHQIGPSFTDGTAILTGTWGANQEASATVFSVNQRDQCFQEVELRLRSTMTAHNSTGYEIGYKTSQTSQAYFFIVRWNGALGDFTTLVQNFGAAFGVKTGDVIRATVIGNTIIAYKNGVELGRVTDNTFTSGNPGIGFNLGDQSGGCAGSNPDYGLTNFTASELP